MKEEKYDYLVSCMDELERRLSRLEADLKLLAPHFHSYPPLNDTRNIPPTGPMALGGDDTK